MRKNVIRIVAGTGNNSGMHTIEASLLIPVILFLVAGVILLTVSQGRRETLRGELYQALYTIPVAAELDASPQDELRSRADFIQSGASRAGAEDASSGDQLALNGSVPYSGVGSYSGILPVHVERERDLCSNRLRRWQFYGNLTEE